MAKEEHHNDLITCICQWQNNIFIGVVLFITGVLMWLANARIINPNLLWTDVLMIAGLLFALKGAFFSAFKK
ncbi:MAG: hypothetical protein PHC66_00160 [Candidatus Nanoarchaeia archaeon]|nr:hypothetical protein [Candidatus Nanoarchaeia archaeon]MDD5239637.1 hypothetical protein [Candidatus Nanoarchaeia archaeon]